MFNNHSIYLFAVFIYKHPLKLDLVIVIAFYKNKWSFAKLLRILITILKPLIDQINLNI